MHVPRQCRGQAATFDFDNSYARELQGLYVDWQPAEVPQPALKFLNRPLATELGLSADDLAAPGGVAVLAGNRVPTGASPLAQAYAGHQFGGFSPRLGDGRALLLGEVVDRHGQRRDIAFKGSGRTPFSRGGDGKATLGPVLREVLMGEAMHALGIPTTRALAAVSTGEQVFRETPLPGAVLTRVAASHLRVGTFQYFAARQDLDRLQRLTDYAIARHDPALATHERPALALLGAVCERQARLIAQWMSVGFIHGVMNTDNMTISGETIDYGPCAFLEAYDPATVFSSIDRDGRYAYGRQPGIAQWNLARLAEALLPLIDADAERAATLAFDVLKGFGDRYTLHDLALWRAKLGLVGEQQGDAVLRDDWLALLQRGQVDFTLGCRSLVDAAQGRAEAFESLTQAVHAEAAAWLQRWHTRRNQGAGEEGVLLAMRRASPAYIPRNHLVEAALQAAVHDSDLGPFEQLLTVLRNPFDARPEHKEYAQPALPEQTRVYQTFCGT
ncbi:YdiU family protein [Jeongeupia wiesaeckerbachi]|uniref:protein adenylyltransferase SelO n=1 Tax=Jeongeupia wiesaeckerbachi TaxID=3051218 RepID=UPI003D808344